jgi:glycosyltransferase involved in cell wall biosynthesis
MQAEVSIVIATYNAESFLPLCLEAALSCGYDPLEVVVVDDASTDDTARIAERYPVKLIRHDTSGGAAVARNRGAREASGEILFFTDHDCLIQPGAVDRAVDALRREGDVIVGGTYTLVPYDSQRFSASFQSLHVHYFETKHREPDYVAAHALAVSRELFLRVGGFEEADSFAVRDGFGKDVQLCHRARSAGHRILADPSIQVQHIFGFNFRLSLLNAFSKSRLWTNMALADGSLVVDSGSASTEMKLSAPTLLLGVTAGVAGAIGQSAPLAAVGGILVLASVALNTPFYSFIRRARGLGFMLGSIAFYSLMLLVILAGSGVGIVQHLLRPRNNRETPGRS